MSDVMVCGGVVMAVCGEVPVPLREIQMREYVRRRATAFVRNGVPRRLRGGRR